MKLITSVYRCHPISSYSRRQEAGGRRQEEEGGGARVSVIDPVLTALAVAINPT